MKEETKIFLSDGRSFSISVPIEKFYELFLTEETGEFKKGSFTINDPKTGDVKCTIFTRHIVRVGTI